MENDKELQGQGTSTEQVRYDHTVLNAILANTGPSQLGIQIYFPSNEVETFTEQWSYDLTQLIGEMGGSIGLFLGLSFLSLFVGLEVAFRAVANAVHPPPQKK
jgi:hypothetical protein